MESKLLESQRIITVSTSAYDLCYTGRTSVRGYGGLQVHVC